MRPGATRPGPISRISKRRLKELNGAFPRIARHVGLKRNKRNIRRVSKRWKDKPDLILRPDGREVCNPGTIGGRTDYKLRTLLLWLRQYVPQLDQVLCCNCLWPLKLKEATFEHENGRNAMYRDDRIADSDGLPLNGASHGWCNVKRGSVRTSIFHGSNSAEALLKRLREVA